MRSRAQKPDTASAGAPDAAGDAPDETVTRLLAELRAGDRAAFDRAASLMYGELRRVAARQLRGERGSHTLLPTALVHEAYVRLSAASGLELVDRAHFLAVAARAMRQVLVDYARHRCALKRGGDLARTTLDGKEIAAPGRDDDLQMLALDEALDRLGALDRRAQAIVEHRFFAGLSEEETAALLGVSARTVRREWVKARAWLHKELDAAGAPS